MRSYFVPIDRESFCMNEYFGFMTMYMMLTHMYYVTFVQWGRKNEQDTATNRNRNSPIFQHVQLFEGIISNESM